jgi:hypothetical protein
MGRKIIVEIVNNKPRSYYYKNNDNQSLYENFVEIDEDKINLEDLDCYVYVNNELKFDNNLLKTKQENKKTYLKKKILSDLEIAKENALNDEIELEAQIGSSKEKVIFVSDSYSRRLFIDNLSFIKILNKDKFKIRVRNSKNQLIFIEIKDDLIKKISENIFNTIEQVELIEQTVLQGLDKYTLEQLEQLNVYEFFES